MLFPCSRNLFYFEKGDAASLFNDLTEEFDKANLSVVNLECPLMKRPDPTDKTGPTLGADSKCISALKIVDVLNLANNHIMDHGKDGLENTITLCKREQIGFVGAGKNLSEAQRVLIQKIKGIRVGIMGVAEHEFSIATKDKCGANPLDIIGYMRYVREHKTEWDYLIVLLHGGNEYYPYPSPRLRRICRFLVEEGANTVICQHSHCPGCYENYKNGKIVYGQGNLLFDRQIYGEKDWNKGFLVQLTLENKGQVNMVLIPYTQSSSSVGARKMNDELTKTFLHSIEQRSEEILQQNFLENKWKQFCASKKDAYLGLLCMPRGRFFSIINRKFHLVDKLLSDKKKGLY